MTTIRVRKSTQGKVSALASARGVSQSDLLDQLLRHEEERRFWVGLGELSPVEYRAALAADGDLLDEGFDAEDAVES